MKYAKKIEGERIYLSPMNPDDAETYLAWINDVKVAAYLGPMYARMVGLNGERAFLESAGQQGHDYSIVLKDGDKLIGSVGLTDIDHRSCAATLGVFIGDAAYREKGYGTEAVKLIVEYGFQWLNVHNIMLTVRAVNERAIACYKKVGFREFGRRTQSTFFDGRLVDDVYMEMVSDK